MSNVRSKRIVLAVSINALLLLLILLALVTRDGRGFSSMAFGQYQAGATLAAPAGLTVMPCQLSQTTWGCYLMDTQNQTLCVYQYKPGESLKLLAARDIQYDRKLGLFNTSPSPTEIKALVERAEEPARTAPTTNRSPEQ